ncbi:MAG: acetylornithine transaminase [Actinomycetia bacterium]|nr:acetylornithine transaminase [Actinomycetes bacterium]
MTGPGLDWPARYHAALAHTFGAPRRVLARAEGTHVWDVDGRCYTDFLSGIAVTVLGHAHPAVGAAVSAQLGQLDHVSNFFATPPQITLAERLGALASPDGRPAHVFFGNSGAEANEAAFKLTRLTGRTRIVAMEDGFHGRTMGALAVTHHPSYREPFAPLPGEVVFAPYGDVDALRAAVDATTAAVVVEPVQGESGVKVAPPGFLSAARAITAEAGALLWVDEVQSGLGRCGEWLVSVADGVAPDIVTLAKGLGNGFPIGACIALGAAGELFTPGSHGTTFGGNPVAAAAGLAVLDTLRDEQLVEAARNLGDHLAAAIAARANPLIALVRGRGLLRGIVLARPIAAAVNDALLEAGWIANAPRPDVIRVAPPLIVTRAELDAFAVALDQAVTAVADGKEGEAA